MQISQGGAVNRPGRPLIVASTAIILSLHLLNAAFTLGHTSSPEVRYPDGRVIHEAESGPSGAEIASGSLHLLGVVLAVAAAVLLFRHRTTTARRAYVASAVCGLFPSPPVGLICLILGALATRA